MKKLSFFAGCLFLSASLLYGTSSYTSKSDNVSVQNSKDFVANPDSENDNADPLALLKEGNKRFVAGKALHIHQTPETVKELALGQHPKAVVIGCSDSRVAPEILFDQGMGDLFVIRTAGNVMSDYEIGSIEYAVDHLDTKLIVVMGHYGCGAIHAMLEHLDDDDVPGHIASIVKCLKDEEEEQEVLKSSENLSEDAVKANVLHGVKKLRKSDPILKELCDEGKIKIVGAVYHLDSGKVDFI